MADQPVPVPYPNTDATTINPIPANCQPAHSQTTHPSTTAHDPAPETPHSSDQDESNTR